ncbi:hypothetical protein VP01_7489g1 [Puccinia sorghi]|uniref:Uncharacterized protein n=1 Tax=Puccinia sorghi TaxID=27349 RepID=A0A0L6UEG1_9BASI|nr:hypothetical protein VP01_7489g1 [Puccinia sorghi]
MILLSAQAVGMHNNLERLIERDRLLSITEGWNFWARDDMEMRSLDKAERARSRDQPVTQNMWIS